MDLQVFSEMVVQELSLSKDVETAKDQFEKDRLPEFISYKDDGCDISPSCLRCPLPKCRYDDPGWFRREVKAKRDQEVLKVKAEEGLGPSELAAKFGVSRRTIHRILKEHKV